MFLNGNPTRVMVGPSVLVLFHHEADTYWAESPNDPGWTAATDSMDELRALVDEARELKFGPWTERGEV